MSPPGAMSPPPSGAVSSQNHLIAYHPLFVVRPSSFVYDLDGLGGAVSFNDHYHGHSDRLAHDEYHR